MLNVKNVQLEKYCDLKNTATWKMSNVKNPKLKNVQAKLQTLCKFYCIAHASSVALMQDVLQSLQEGLRTKYTNKSPQQSTEDYPRTIQIQAQNNTIITQTTINHLGICYL